MSERYRLVFCGEVLEGQHKAVVKQRLGVALKVEGERLDAMFTGKPVTIRKDADTDTAARFQIAFKRAGARLRVMPVTDELEQIPESVSKPAPAQQPAAKNDGAFKLAPPGALMADPAPPARQRDVDLSQFTLAAAGTVLGVPRVVDAVAPDVSHFTIAAPGVTLSDAEPLPVMEPDAPSWDVAEVGADIGTSAPSVEPPFELDDIEFELAPVGTLLADADDAEAPQPPDTSHLSLQ
jgi:hypothetical protein